MYVGQRALLKQNFQNVGAKSGQNVFLRRVFQLCSTRWLLKPIGVVTPSGVLVSLTVGTLGLSSQELSTLQYEDSQHGDLLLLPELRDDYHNLTTKVLLSFRWIDRNVQSQFVFKVRQAWLCSIRRVGERNRTRPSLPLKCSVMDLIAQRIGHTSSLALIGTNTDPARFEGGGGLAVEVLVQCFCSSPFCSVLVEKRAT